MAWPARATMRIHLVRGVLSSLMAVLFFWGLVRVPLAQGVALAFIAPLIALYLAAMLLGERIERRAILASLIGFAGVIVILAGQWEAGLGPDAFRGALAILGSACLYAYNIILMRRQALVAGPVEIAFFMSLIMSICFAFAAPWLAELPARPHLVPIGGAALLAFASLMLLSWAYARAEAQYLAPVEYTALGWAVLFGITVFHEPVRPLTLVGAAMIIVACLFAARRSAARVADVEAAI
jgi:S-adenosylmethionine uptake transporter